MKQVWSENDRSIWATLGDPERRLASSFQTLIDESPFAFLYERIKNRTPLLFFSLVETDPVGFLIADRQIHDLSLPLEEVRNGFLQSDAVEPREIWSIVCIYITPPAQRNGYGKQLCLSGCSHLNLTPATIGWASPISEQGQALLRSLGVQIVKITAE